MKILVYGVGGTMGRFVVRSAEERGVTVACGVDKYYVGSDYAFPVYKDCSAIAEKPDCIIDFSVPQGIYDYLPYAVKNGIPCVIATTGFAPEDEKYIADAAKKIAVLKSGNLSYGINLLLHLTKEAAKATAEKAEIEIIEQHHDKKADAPSGTALLLADGIKSVLPERENKLGRSGKGKRTKNEIGIHAIRGGTVVGKHSVLFMMDGEVITLTHEAENKSILSGGSLTAAEFIVRQKPGLYTSADMFK